MWFEQSCVEAFVDLTAYGFLKSMLNLGPLPRLSWTKFNSYFMQEIELPDFRSVELLLLLI